MSVSFSEDLVEIKEYYIEYSEKLDKKKALCKIKNNNQTTMIRNILYKYIPTEEEYIERKNKGRSGSINIEGYQGSDEEDLKTIYYNPKKNYDRQKIQYNIYMNNMNVIIARLNIEGFGGQKHYIKYISSGNLFDDLFSAEYKAKMFVIETIRKIFKKNNIY